MVRKEDFLSAEKPEGPGASKEKKYQANLGVLRFMAEDLERLMSQGERLEERPRGLMLACKSSEAAAVPEQARELKRARGREGSGSCEETSSGGKRSRVTDREEGRFGVVLDADLGSVTDPVRCSCSRSSGDDYTFSSTRPAPSTLINRSSYVFVAQQIRRAVAIDVEEQVGQIVSAADLQELHHLAEDEFHRQVHRTCMTAGINVRPQALRTPQLDSLIRIEHMLRTRLQMVREAENINTSPTESEITSAPTL